MKYCPGCGHGLLPGVRFCSDCGENLALSKADSNANSLQKENDYQENADTEIEAPKEDLPLVVPYEEGFSKRHPIFTTVVAFVFIVLLIGITVSLDQTNNASSDPSGTSTVVTDNSSISTPLPTDTPTQKPAVEPGTIGWYLKQPAPQYLTPGPAMQTLTQIMGISLNNGERPITVKEMADQIYTASGQLAGQVLTKNDIEIGLQPGNGLYTFFAGLLNGPESYQAIVYELLLDGSRNS